MTAVGASSLARADEAAGKQPGQGDIRLKAALSAISFCFDTIEIITQDMK